jgi:hypothetical protein
MLCQGMKVTLTTVGGRATVMIVQSWGDWAVFSLVMNLGSGAGHKLHGLCHVDSQFPWVVIPPALDFPPRVSGNQADVNAAEPHRGGEDQSSRVPLSPSLRTSAGHHPGTSSWAITDGSREKGTALWKP